MGRASKFVLVAAILLIAMPSFSLDVSVKTNKYSFNVNESIYSSVVVSDNTTAISNESVLLTVKDSSGAAVSSSSLTTNSTGGANYTFSLSSSGNYTILANASGTVVSHFIKVLPYSKILISLNKPSYSTDTVASLVATVVNSNGNGVPSVLIMPNLRYKNGTLISEITSCTTDSVGKCSTSFTVPSTEGEYIVEINKFEQAVPLLVGGFSASMKISPTVVGRGDNVTIRITVKNANGNGATASTRQLVITAPNGTKTTVTAMTQATDSSATSLTGVYEDKFSSTGEGIYSVTATVTAQGSNITKELLGSFEVRAYVMEISAWDGQLVFYPGSTVTLGLKLKNASTSDNIAGKATTITSGAKIYDPSGVDTAISPTVTDQVSTDGKYKMSFLIPGTSASGTYKVLISINDTFGSGSGIGYFTIQRAKGFVVSMDTFPNGVSQRDFVAGKKIVLRFSAQNVSGTVPVTGISSYSIADSEGNDKTSLFGTNATYTSGNYTYINLTAPVKGGDYFVKAQTDTPVGSVSVDGNFKVRSLDVTIRPVSAGSPGSTTPTPGAGGPGPGFFWFFRPNDTVQLNVSVTTASEKQGNEGFMSKGSFGGGPRGVEGGLFGIGGGSSVQGAQVTVTKIINLNTEEDWTSSVTLTNCVTDSSGSCAISMKSSVNGQNWTGGFYIAFFNLSTSDNKTDRAQGFFDVRKYFMDVTVRANTTTDASSLGFNSFQNWNVGPNTAVNVSVTVREPGTWQTANRTGTLTISGVFYGGNAGEFIFPPKKIDSTNTTIRIDGGSNSTVISAPATGWKSGFYIVKVIVNFSGGIDSGEGFFMSKIFEGFGMPVNPETNVPDFTIGKNENVSMKIDVFNVVNYRPAANLTVSLKKILSFASFPPSELTYDKTVTQGTTDASGRVLMTLEPPTGGWSNGQYLIVFDVTNGTVTDQVEGFFMVRNFFAEISSSNWRYGRSDNINFTATISSDPSWMRNQFGGGCPPEDTTCGGGGGPIGTPEAILEEGVVVAGRGFDLDGDTFPDINMTTSNVSDIDMANLSAVNLTSGGVTKNSTIAFMGCMNSVFSKCVSGEKILSDYDSGGPFQGFKCTGPGFAPVYSNQGYRNTTNMTLAGSYNATHTRYFCVNSTTGKYYKLGMRGPGNSEGNVSNWSIGYIQDLGETSGLGGSSGVSVGDNSQTSYYNVTLKSVKVAKFDFSSGETVLQEKVDYNVTSKDGTIKGTGNILIPGVGTFVLKPLDDGAAGGTWDSGDYFVSAEFNNSLGTEKAEWGFKIETFFASCNRVSWGDIQSGVSVNISCTITDPSSGRAYTGSTETNIESVINSMTGAPVSSSLWSDATTSNNKYSAAANVSLSQSLPNGFYQIAIRINESSDVKRTYVWFDVRDFTPSAWTEKWTYGSSDNITIYAQGTLSGQQVTLNTSYTSGSPEITVYKYDRATWSRSEVSGIALKTSNITMPTRLIMNLSRSGGWDEGSYQAVVNLTRTLQNGSATGGKVEVSTWFDVRLFDVWSWTDAWSNHPKNNMSLKVHVGSPGTSSYYNGQVYIDILSLQNTLTGATLVNGTDYTVKAVSGNPATVGDLNINITPLGSGLPSGTYRAKLKISDANGNVVFSEAWFEVIAFRLYAFASRFEYQKGENVTFDIVADSSSGTPVTLNDVKISTMKHCQSGTCTSVDTSGLIYTYTSSQKRLSLNTTALSEGYYYPEITANDSQNVTSTAHIGYATFRLSSFALSGKILYPFEFAGEKFRYSYYINESMKLNISGSSGVTVSNATFRYWSCDNACVQHSFVVAINRTTQSNAETINITPPGLNNTWPTPPWGWAYYDVEISALKDGVATTFMTSISAEFPGVWGAITGITDITPTSAITSTINVSLNYNRSMVLANANVSVRKIWNTATGANVNTSDSNWTGASNITDAGGAANVSITPAGSFTWPIGRLSVEYQATYGNSTTVGSREVIVAQKNLRIEGKSVYNATKSNQSYVTDNTVSALLPGNATFRENFNISVSINNPSSSQVNADIAISKPVHSTNSSAISNNLTNLTHGNMIMNIGVTRQFNWTFNVTQAGNWTGTITITPKTSTMSVMTTTYNFESK
ncbi:MAG: hypothetical protein HY364_02060 [Candidatus Aenigmarchaeota archaeon]|nr:hypothetical protein [Candidatus Aenigmarchaeota archaeon]